jgi:hypothetical protein
VAEWQWIDNPTFAGKTPAPLKPDCHDRSPFITLHCTCGFDNHVHETSIVEVPPTAAIGSRCNGCGDVLEFPPGYLHAGFAELRRRGWSR